MLKEGGHSNGNLLLVLGVLVAIGLLTTAAQIFLTRAFQADRAANVSLFNYLGPLLNPAEPSAQLMGVSRPDLCGLEVDASAYSVLWNLEAFGEWDACPEG